MKKRYVVFIFVLTLLGGVLFTTCQNPVMVGWWDETNTTRNLVDRRYKVIFNMQGGGYVDSRTAPGFPLSAPADQWIEPGGKVGDPGLIQKPPKPAPPASYLGGWVTAWGQVWNFTTDTVNSDMILYAKWDDTPDSGYKVVFKDDTYTFSKATYTPVDELIAAGALATQPLEFGSTDQNVGFTGWYTANGTPWDFWVNRVDDTADTLDGNSDRTITLYAKWDLNGNTAYKVTWDVNGSPDPAPAPDLNPALAGIMYVEEGAYIPPPVAITNPGYTFGGWYLDDDDNKLTQLDFSKAREWDFAIDKVTDDITLCAKWTVPDMGLVELPGSSYTFIMGGTGVPNTGPQPKIELNRNFYIDQFEVTNAKYKEVMMSSTVPSQWKDDNNPVNRVTWYDAVKYCNILSEREGLPPFYDIENVVWATNDGITFIKDADVYVADYDEDGVGGVDGVFDDDDWDAPGYRLPTEAEWEYAARGGAKSMGYQYAGSDDRNAVAWYDSNAASRTHPVGQKLHNELGLYDMSGNVSEWCWDWYYGTNYNYPGYSTSDPRPDPKGPKESDATVINTVVHKVRRGGNWNMLDVGTRSRTNNTTYSWPPSPADNDLQRYWTIGFRVVRTIPSP